MSVTQRHLGVSKAMWVMQQLGRRVGALDVDLISSQPGKAMSSSGRGLDARKYGKCSRAEPSRLA